MASFTDKSLQFNPYIQELPVQEMYQVGMAKQAQYDQGVQKIQNQVDRVAGLSVYKDIDKKYLESKLGELGNKLKTVAAGDFSNQQLVNSVSGMTGQLAKDPLIQNAVASTARYQSLLQKIQKDTDEGKSNPANIKNFQKQAAPWLNSQKPGEVFNGSYTPHFDIMKFAREQFNAIKPGELTFDQVYETDSEGNIKYNIVKDKKGNIISQTPVESPYMVKMKEEGRLPAEVQGALNQIFSDPRVKQQLQITGEYNYANLNDQELVSMVYDQRDAKLRGYNDKVAELTLKKSLEKDEESKKAIQAQIDKLETDIDSASSSYDKLAGKVTENPDSIRGYLYKENSLDNLRGMYGSVRKSKEIVDSPLFEANFKTLQEANDMKVEAAKLAFDYANLKEVSRQKQLDRESAEKIAALKGTKTPGGPGAPLTPDRPEADENPSDIDPVVSHELTKANAGAEMLTSGYNLVWDGMFANNPKNIIELTKQMATGKTRDQGIETLIKNSAAKNKEDVTTYVERFSQKVVDGVNGKPGGVPPALRDSYDLYKKKQKTFQSLVQEGEDVNKAAALLYGNDLVDVVNTTDIKDTPMKFQGNDVVVTKQDYYDLALYAKGNVTIGGYMDSKIHKDNAKAAEARLTSRGKAFLLPTVLDKFATSYFSPSGIVRDVKSTIRQGVELLPFTDDVYLRNAKGYDINEMRDDFSINLKKMFKVVDNESSAKVLKAKSEILQNKGYFKPDVKMGVLTGDAETNRQTLNDIRRFTLNYAKSGKNLTSSDELEGMTKVMGGDISDISLEAKTVTGPGGRKLIQILGTDLKNNNSGSIIIADDEAAKLNIDVSTLYEPDEVTNVRRAITRSSLGSTSKLDPSDVNTYVKGDAYFEKFEFPRMKGVTRYDLKANVVFNNGKYYGYVYASDGQKRKVSSTEGDPDLNVVIKGLQQLGPEHAQLILK